MTKPIIKAVRSQELQVIRSKALINNAFNRMCTSFRCCVGCPIREALEHGETCDNFITNNFNKAYPILLEWYKYNGKELIVNVRNRL